MMFNLQLEPFDNPHQPGPNGFINDNAVWTDTSIEQEKGRWAVYLEVGFWEPNEAQNLQTVRHRIRDYPKKEQAEVAASWILRTVSRDLQHPPTGLV